MTSFLPMRGSGGIKRLGLCKKLGVRRKNKAIQKWEETGRRSKVIPSLGNFKIRNSVHSKAAPTAGTSTGASPTHDIPILDVDEDGELTITSRSLPGQASTSTRS